MEHADGSGLRRVTEGRGEREPSLASTGSQMVFADSNGVLYLADLDGSGTTRLTSSQRNGNPDGRWVSSYARDAVPHTCAVRPHASSLTPRSVQEA